MMEEIRSIVDALEAGDSARGTVYTDLLYMTPAYGVQPIMDALPYTWRREFTAWLIENYDNESPVEDYLAFGLSADEEAVKDLPIPLVRNWLRSRSL
jgi:hypothetical protein